MTSKEMILCQVLNRMLAAAQNENHELCQKTAVCVHTDEYRRQQNLEILAERTPLNCVKYTAQCHIDWQVPTWLHVGSGKSVKDVHC